MSRDLKLNNLNSESEDQPGMVQDELEIAEGHNRSEFSAPDDQPSGS